MSRPLLAICLALAATNANAQLAVGQWRDHFPYRRTIAVAEGANGEAWCATKTGVFRYDPNTAEIDKYTKVNALSDVSIRSIAWCDALQRLVVGYDNGNLDLLGRESASNMSDIKRSSILGDKGINHILLDGSTAYLSCGFGIVVVDLAALEVRETWLIGPSGTQLAVYASTFHGDSIQAATGAGLYSAWRYEANLATFTSWHKHLEIPNPNGAFSAVVSFDGKLVVNYRYPGADYLEKDTLYWWDGQWNKITSLIGQHNYSVIPSADGTLLDIATRWAAREFDGGFNQVGYYDYYATEIMEPAMAVHGVSGNLWVADRETGLRKAGQGIRIEPNGPRSTGTLHMDAAAGAVYCSTGGVAGNWSNIFQKDGFLSFIDGQWASTYPGNDALMASGGNAFGGAVNDVMVVAVDPEDPYHAFAGSFDDGLLEIRDRHVTGFYNAGNSTLVDDPTNSEDKVNVAGLDFDANGNLWMSNTNAPGCIAVRTKAGAWYSFTPGAALNGNNLISEVMASQQNNLKWFIRPRGNGLLVFDDGGTPDQAGDDHYQAMNTYEGQGHLPSIDVFSVAEDLDGQVWVGTGKGVAVFYAPEAIFSGGDFDAQQVLIEQDGNVQILLETETVTSIAVDGANRKWIATQNSGVYLISSDGTQQVHHFDITNSPMPSNNVSAVAIDGITGEVFIGTDQGIMSYRSDATGGSLTAGCANVFPNPVHPTYTGPISITGLVRDSKVSITDMAGNLVYRTTSNGGEASWPGTDMEGKRVSTGVYLALAVDPTGESKCNTRILVVR